MRRVTRKGPEHRVQCACVRWFRLAHRDLSPLFFAVPNGSRRTQWEQMIAKEEGLVAGVSDTLLLVPSSQYHGLCVEFKKEVETWEGGKRHVERGYQSADQKAWQKAVEERGYKYAVVHTLDEFTALIGAYLGQ